MHLGARVFDLVAVDGPSARLGIIPLGTIARDAAGNLNHRV